jgi:hypothetical protein
MAAGEALDEDTPSSRLLPRATAPPPRLKAPFETTAFLGAIDRERNHKEIEKIEEKKNGFK